MSENTCVSIDQAKEKLKEHFGYDNFKSDVQQKAIMCILNGKCIHVIFSFFISTFVISKFRC